MFLISALAPFIASSELPAWRVSNIPINMYLASVYFRLIETRDGPRGHFALKILNDAETARRARNFVQSHVKFLDRPTFLKQSVQLHLRGKKTQIPHIYGCRALQFIKVLLSA